MISSVYELDCHLRFFKKQVKRQFKMTIRVSEAFLSPLAKRKFVPDFTAAIVIP